MSLEIVALLQTEQTLISLIHLRRWDINFGEWPENQASDQFQEISDVAETGKYQGSHYQKTKSCCSRPRLGSYHIARGLFSLKRDPARYSSLRAREERRVIAEQTVVASPRTCTCSQHPIHPAESNIAVLFIQLILLCVIIFNTLSWIWPVLKVYIPSRGL